MRNEVIFDRKGIPDIMVVFTPDELGLPAEIRGKAVKETRRRKSRMRSRLTPKNWSIKTP